MSVSKKTHREVFPDTADLVDACIDGGVARVKQLQDGKDWLPLLAAYFDAESDEVLAGPHR